LREHLNRQANDQLTAGSAWTDSGDLVFASRWGEPLYPDAVTALMNKIITACNKGASATQAEKRKALGKLGEAIG
jgi:hypothetical protein